MNINEDTLYRRYVGLILGSSLGFVYGLVSQSLTQVFLTHIPLYRPPLGLPGNILLWSLSRALIGLVTTLLSERISGVVYGGATGAFLVSVLTLASGRTEQGARTAKIISVIFLFIPLAGCITPIAALLLRNPTPHIESSTGGVCCH